MSQVENLTIYFVLPSDNATEDDVSEDMRLAHNTVLKYGARTKWFQPSSCLNLAVTSKDIFIFDKFEGNAFEELQKQSSKCVLLGARCMLTCLTGGRSIPKSLSPVYTEGMRDLVICCSGFDSPMKNNIKDKVEYMAGIYVKSLRGITTHLIAHNNITAKAIEAYKSNLPIMRYEWVEAVWERSKVCNVNGKDDEFNIFKSPLFHNLKITTSGISKTEKNRIKELIEKHGGTFSGTLEEKNTNILIVTKPEGEKFKFAKLWKIICVKPSWLYNSANSQFIHPFNAYSVESKAPKCSTPNKEDPNFTANFSMMSAITQDSVTRLEETGMTLSNNSDGTQFQTPKKLFHLDNDCDIINNILLKNLKDVGQFLDGCNIYLCGFHSENLEKLKKILNVGGATRFNELTDFVTHVIVGKKTDSLLASLKNSSAYVLSINWLVESMKLKKPAPESDFIVLDNGRKNAEPPSPLSKLGAKLLTTEKNKEFEKPQFSLEKENKFTEMEVELLCKYKESQPGEPLAQQRQTALTRSTNSSVLSRQSSTQSNIEVFKDLTFFLSSEIDDEEKKQIEEIIVTRSGTVVGKRFLGVPDYAIVPICGASLSEMTTKEVVNVFFIKDCCLEETVVALQYYHQPVACVKGSTPLKNCVISVTNYIQCEREFIETLIEILGAIPQSLLARKPKENVFKSTHLICAEPTGQKYQGALRWGLPVVHHDWLLKCAALGIRISEEPYLMTNYKLSATSNETRESGDTGDMGPTRADEKTKIPSPVPENPAVANYEASQSQPDKTLRSKNAVQFASSKDSPMHNAISRLKNLSNNVSSPDANRTLTPTSPYGAFYGNDNPSPGTRKRLWKWMHQGADFPLDPPTEYQSDSKRRDSTPLSSVLSKLLVSLKRNPEEIIPNDSPVSTARKQLREGEPHSPTEIPFKRLNLDATENARDTKMNGSSMISTGLQKMKEIEGNYARDRLEHLNTLKKQGDSAPEMLVVAESQPLTEVGWEDPIDKEGTTKNEAKMVLKEKFFMLTCLPDAGEVSKLIEQCGGKVSTLPHFDKNATHIISKDLTRDEKLMASIASGLWVLHPSYIDELRVVKDVHKIDEEFYEWGNPSQASRTDSLSSNTKAFANCSREWRLAIKEGKPPPFKGIKMILHLRMSKYDNFRRLIEAGGGEIIAAKPPYTTDTDVDLCIVEAGYTEGIDFEEFAKRKVPCVTILYISDKILNKADAIDKNIAQSFLKYWNKKV